MNLTGNTSEILAWKALNRNVDKRWVDWAAGMLEAGFETPSLIILAGESEPNNQFELQELTKKVFRELNLDYSNKNQTIENYCTFLIDQYLLGTLEDLKVLEILKNLCIELDMDQSLFDFYLLYFAKEDLIDSGHQFYWPDADRNTINQVILDYFNKWKLDHSTQPNQ